MKASQIAVQAYTLRDSLGSAAEIAQALRKIKAIGYPAVQLYGLSVPDAEVAAMLKDSGLTCCSMHQGGDALFDDTSAVITRANAFGCNHIAYPWPHLPTTTLDEVKTLAARLNDAGRKLLEAGITLSYHNHSIEFRKLEGKLVLDVIYAETDPRYLQGEIDTYWVQTGGGDPGGLVPQTQEPPPYPPRQGLWPHPRVKAHLLRDRLRQPKLAGDHPRRRSLRVRMVHRRAGRLQPRPLRVHQDEL